MDKRKAARELAAEIRAFSRECENDSYTDTELAWALLDAARKLLADIGRKGV